MRAIFIVTVPADSDDIVMVDGNSYFPSASMVEGFFRESDHSTLGPRLEWNGSLLGCSGRRTGDLQRRLVLDTPKPEAESILERYAFYRDKVVELQ